MALKIVDFPSAEIVENIGEESPKYYVFVQTTGVSTQAHVTPQVCYVNYLTREPVLRATVETLYQKLNTEVCERYISFYFHLFSTK